MSIRHHPHTLPGSQHGAALVTGLLIMIVMTLIGITTMQSSITQSNLASNAQLSTIGFQSTEAALTRASNDASLLEQALDNGVDVNTDFLDYNRFLAVLDIKKNSDGTEDKTSTAISTTIQVTPLGETPCPIATGINANTSTTVSTPICTAFALVASTAVGSGSQVSTRHSQVSARLMPSQPSGMKPYRPF